ncbi:MAG: VWA domain-containing protein [Gemmatimonadetes bacterium]|nr:VWA domain-containing protein [Gemmatimonadota bacterium]
MTRFVDHPWLLAVALLGGLFAVFAVFAGHRRRQERLARFGSPEALVRLGPPGLSLVPRLRALRLAVAFMLLLAGLAAPRWGQGSAVIDTEGIDVALALDVSLSMLAEDERPSRLERMKQEVRRFRASAPGDRVALIAFAGRSYILSPLTSDDGALELFLENLDPTIVGQVGSALAPPLKQGIDLLSVSQGGADRALVVMSDGEAFDDHAAALALAREAKAKGIHLVTVGFGTPGGATIPMLESGGTEVKRDAAGEVVITKYDDAFLSELASEADGEFIAADASDKGTRVRRALAQLESTRREEEQKLARPLRFQWFVGLAVLLLLVDAWRADGGRLPRRRAAISVTLLLALLGIPTRARAQRDGLAEAIRLHEAGRILPAIKAYRGVIAGGDRRPIVLYDLGTALLAADSLAASIDALERATFTPDPDLRSRALYNLGTAYLKQGLRSEGEQRSGALRNARRALRTVLLERPGDRDAQWNYELALRAPQGGGGGGSPQQPQQPGQSPRQPEPQGRMSRQQAEALLDAAAREERETQSRRQRGSRGQRAPGEKDW